MFLLFESVKKKSFVLYLEMFSDFGESNGIYTSNIGILY